MKKETDGTHKMKYFTKMPAKIKSACALRGDYQQIPPPTISIQLNPDVSQNPSPNPIFVF